MPFHRPLGERTDNQRAPNFVRPLNDRRAVVGERVVLECQVDGHPDPTVKWLKDGQNVTQCPDYHIVEDGGRHRLEIAGVQGADSGRFTAQAMNAAGLKQSTCILIVAPAPTPVPGARTPSASGTPGGVLSPGPPQTPVGPSAPIFLKELKHQPLKPGGLLVLEARVAGIPVPTLEWFKNGKPLQNYRAKAESDPTSGICALTIPQMFNDDVGEYTLKATNQHGEASTTAQLLPREQFDRWFSDEQEKITKARKATMIAQAQRNAARQQQQQGRTGLQSTSDAESLDMPWGVSESETEPELAALDARGTGTRPIIRSPLRGLRLTEGTDAILQTSVVGMPKPRISWLKNGATLNPSGPPRIVMSYRGSMAVLKISMVTPEDTADYSLVAENRYGKVESSARIEVYPLPDEPLNVQEERVKQAQYEQHVQYLKQQQLAREEAEREQRAREQRRLEEERRRQEEERRRLDEERRRQEDDRRRLEEERRRQEQLRRREEEARQESRRRAEELARFEEEARLAFSREERARAEQQQRRERLERERQAQALREQQWRLQRQQQQQAAPYRLQYIEEQERLQRELPQQAHYHQPHQHRFEEQQQRFQAPQRHHPQQHHYQEQHQQFYQEEPEYHEYHIPHEHRYREREREEHSEMAFRQVRPQQQQAANAPNGGPPKNQSVIMPPNQRSVASAPTSTSTANGSAKVANGSAKTVKPPQFIVQPQSVNAKAGEQVVFSAKVTGDPLPELQWTRADGSAIPAAGRLRAENFADGSARFTIDKVEPSDAQTYSVVAKNPGGSFQSRFTLNVLQQKNAGAPQFVGKFNSVTAFEGDSLKLYCKAAGDGVKTAWFRDNDPITDDEHYKVEGTGAETTLHLNRAQLKHGGWYRCEATNAAGSTSLKGRVVVQTRQKLASPSPREQITLRKVDRRHARTPTRGGESTSAPSFKGQLQPLNLIEGQTARFEVQFSPADDQNLKIAWLHNGKALLASSRVVTLSDFGLAVLEINPVTIFDAGEYTIVAVNPLGESRQTVNIQVIGHGAVTTSQSTQLVMGTAYQSAAPPPDGRNIDLPNFHSELRSQEIFEGQPIHLETKVTPINDPQLRVDWFLNGQPVGGHAVTTQSHGFATLDISQATAQDAGLYTAVATNEVGSADVSATVLVHPPVEFHQHLEGSQRLDVEDVREIQFAAQQGAGVPTFLSQLKDFHCDQELGRSYFEARIQPINDPSLRVSWLKDGHALPNANRIQTFHNFGYVSLTIHPTYPEDTGTYTAVLHNVYGETQSSANLTTIESETLQLDSKHVDSLQQIGYLDSQVVHIGPQSVERPEEFHSMEQPRFARPLPDRLEVNENDAVHFECRLQPASDVKMQVEWYRNGAPLPAAHRFRPMFDFGYVALDLLYAYAEDSGTYTLVARNELGEAQCSLELIVHSQKSLYLDPNHPEGLERIQELEQSRITGLPEIADRGCDEAPRFTGELRDLQLQEHEDIHQEIRVSPVHDPTMVVEWFVNGAPLLTGSRVRSLYEFGFISLDIKGAIAEDSGTYTLRATNALGEATRECQIIVSSLGTILSDTQHEESLGKINYLENLNRYGRVELDEGGPTQAPQFIVPLPATLGQIEESAPIHLECQVKPLNDNSLRVTWLKDGHPLPQGHRFRTFYDFGFVSLDILNVYAEDTGTYTCHAENALGSAETSVTFSCEAKAAILGETQHPNSYARIQEIEAPKAAAPEAPEAAKQAPQFVKHLGEAINVNEGESVYLEAQVQPADDNSLTYEWRLNGAPLPAAHRYVLSQDFGYIALNILYFYPEDSGEYSLVVRNSVGEAQSSINIHCAILGGGPNFTDTFHPSSIQRIAELEAPQLRAEALPDAEKQAPSIVKGLPGDVQTLHESQTLHLEAQVLPVDDNTLVAEWYFNGFPLKASSRYRVLNDFGFVSLDIDYVIAEDAGEYTLVVSNAAGKAQTSTRFEVERLKSILSDTNHPESLRRIREMEGLQQARPDDEEAPPEPPSFSQELQGPTEILKEGQSVHMDCVVQPINDPTLRIEWYHNEQPLSFGSRIRTLHDFGYVGLEFLHIHPEDSGIYTCRAVNRVGEALTSFQIECKPHLNIYLDTQHDSSWARIQELEAPKGGREPSPEISFPPPTFTQQLQNIDGLVEGQPARLEARLIPVNDPTLKVIWTRNGAPLPQGSRFMPARNFDLVTLDILGVNPEDAGLYTCKAVSAFGEAATSATVKCQATDALLLGTQHEASWKRVQDLENRAIYERVYEDAEQVPPRFVVDLPPDLGIFNEGAPIHLECQVEPTNDSELGVQWYHNGAPLANGHRFRTTHDFGYVALDILYAFAEDAGEWVAQAKNRLGEATTGTVLQVAPRGTIVTDTQHPDSWQRIQELEAPKLQKEASPEKEHGPPQLGPMESLDRIEFQPAHFETRLTPINDPTMRIQWFKDGAPLPSSNRFKHTADFGYIALDLSHTVSEDAGLYAVVATNSQGEAHTTAELRVTANPAIIGDVQHESSWQKIQEFEAPRDAAPAEEERLHGPPRFIRQLNSIPDVIEGQPSHFEAQFEPFTDPNTTVQWYLNGQPLSSGSRRILRNDFGLVSLDLQYTLGEDAGEYRVEVRNREGSDATTGTLQCTSRASILGDTQHAASWQRIQELEAPRQLPEAAEAPAAQKPTFTQPLTSAEVADGGVALLEAHLIPVNDPKLNIYWFFNDSPLGESNWIRTGSDFGYVSLRIAPTHSRHAGVYSCKAVNEVGTAVTSASISVVDSDSLQLDTSHPESLAKIRELEALNKYGREEQPDREFEKPVWVQPFENVDNVPEGGQVELHGLLEPSGDPNLRVEWFLNGAPLLNANRFRQEMEFGNVFLNIVHVFPQDSGVYTCKATNLHGEATTSATVKVAGYERIVSDTQHPLSWQRIQELEAPKYIEELEETVEVEKPVFLTQLESVEVPEGSPVLLEATFQPARDANLQVLWEKNGFPVGASQLVQARHELGWAQLRFLSANEDHNGLYTLRIANAAGEAVSSATLRVVGVGHILGDTRHEESWRRIQELEAPREAAPEPEAPIYDHPAITTQIPDQEVNEGEHVHLEASFVPFNDPKIQVQWLRNGAPLGQGSKFAISHDFGVSMLDIGYAFPEDAGVYQLKVWNEQGEAVSSGTLKVHSKDSILTDTHHEASWQKIQAMETTKPELEAVEPGPKGPPRFVTQLNTVPDLYEGQPIHLEATIEPIDDPTLQLQWYLNDAPISHSSRVKIINDFGWVILDVSSSGARDTGVWRCVLRNAEGEAESSTQVSVTSRENIATESLQPQSLNRIREIEAGRPLPEEAAPQAVEPPQITVQLETRGDVDEGGSAHLEAQYSPLNVKVEWLRDGQPIFHSNRYRMLNDFGFAILEILHVLQHDSGEYTLRVWNDAGEATSSTTLSVERKSGLILDPQDTRKAKAVEDLELALHRRPDEVADELKEVVPVFIEPLSAPVEAEEGDRVHFTARYEPIGDNKLQLLWYFEGRPLKTGSRVKTLNDFGFVVLEISPVYPEDSGEYICRAVNNAGEAVTSTRISCSPKEGIISKSQLPERMAGAQKRIEEIEAPKLRPDDAPDVEHGPPKFTTPLQAPQGELKEGQLAHFEVQVTPVADPRLKVEWFHNGNPVGHTARMKTIHDFGFVVLELAPAEPQDCGTWTCRATNQHGTDEVSAEISVLSQSGVVTEWLSPEQRKERINELEDWIHRPKEDLTLPAQDYGPPHFTQELADLGTLSEADATAFTCVLEPIGDPTLKVEWTHDGHSIPYSNRIATNNDFGVATLLIKHLISQDTGEYKCIATNSKGTAETVGHIVVESITQVDAPQIVQALVESVDGTLEGDSIHLECRVTPINDPRLSVYWLKNGHPLPEASRFRSSFEFGFVTLDILYAYPEDNGDYQLVAVNDKGEASTQTHIVVLPRSSLDFAPQAHGSRQDNLESHFRQHTNADLALSVEDSYDEARAQPPEFKAPLVNIGVEEGEFARFETQIAPINDPYLKVEWYKDRKPVLIGHRFRSTLDFGFACLDLLYSLPDDTGEYTCVATNRHGQASISAKLACQGGRHIITDAQLPQGLRVTDVKRNQLYWSEGDAAAQQPRQKQAPLFTITPRNTQVVENEPARFECAVVGHPKPKVTWFVNGSQAIQGHRYKLNFDGIHYLTIMHTRIADAGEIMAIARNSEGEAQSVTTLDVFQKDDFRQHKLRPTSFRTEDEIQARQVQWQRETLGKLGEAFETAPRPDSQKLMQVERSKSPIQPLETEELIQKFTRPRDDNFYEQLTYIETSKPQFKGLELQPVALKPGQIQRYEPPQEEFERPKLRSTPSKEIRGLSEEPPDWAQGSVKLGNVEGRFKRLESPPKEVPVPARDLVSLKAQKPKRGDSGERVRIQEERARIKAVQQGPEPEKEEFTPHVKQVQLKAQHSPKLAKGGEHLKIEEKVLKDTPPVVKPTIPESTISSKPQPTRLEPSQKAPPVVSQQLKPVQVEPGKSARFFVSFNGDHPMKVTWFKDGKEIVPSFEFQIKTTNTGSQLDIGRVKTAHGGEYTARIENVAGTVESLANLAVAAPVDRGKAPDFTARLTDQRVQQGAEVVFKAAVQGDPAPQINWFKDGKALPNDERFRVEEVNGEFSLTISSTLPKDVGIYELVAKNAAGEARCKARLNLNLSRTGKGAEEGPRLEAPRFTAQIQPIIVEEGQDGLFTASYTGNPEPMIRWYRNNEPLKRSGAYEVKQANGTASLKIAQPSADDVAEYKVEATNPAGKASSVANLVLAPKAGRVVRTTTTRTSSGLTTAAPTTSSPQFVSKLSDINARQGHNVKFSAEISGDPQPTVQWTHNGKSLATGRDLKISLVGNTAVLELTRVTPAQAGTYVLTIRNPSGAASSQATLTLAR